ncbi:MAG TPA: class I fructose-bisphosphate aldolase [Acidimicrobiales bacterium]|nr:class I fructose-bisphosphate aldolase [Acidimicrobiales bacterium]
MRSGCGKLDVAARRVSRADRYLITSSSPVPSGAEPERSLIPLDDSLTTAGSCPDEGLVRPRRPQLLSFPVVRGRNVRITALKGVRHLSGNDLSAVARQMVAPGKGILAADESTGTITKRFDKVDIESTETSRRDYRELLVTSPGAGDYISGIILYDETIRQEASDGRPFVDMLNELGILPGIKVDTGAKPLALAPEEKVTEGLDGLRERIEEYVQIGAKFAKWRAVITIGPDIPSQYCIEVNAQALARYAALCQEGGLVPIVEPECLIDGDHTIDRCYEVTDTTLHAVFNQLHRQRVDFSRMVLKPNMVISGKDCPDQAGVDEVAERTLEVLRRNVPAAVPGVAFLSGGQTPEQATAHLNAMNLIGDVPWQITFSYARALQDVPLKTWKGDAANKEAAQQAFSRRAKLVSLARRAEYKPDMEDAA